MKPYLGVPNISTLLGNRGVPLRPETRTSALRRASSAVFTMPFAHRESWSRIPSTSTLSVSATRL